MQEIVNKQWHLVKRPKAMLTPLHFLQKQQTIKTLDNNQILLKNLYLSFDPTQRIWSVIDSYVPKIPLNTPMRAFGIGQVIESKQQGFRPGDLVFGAIDWQEYALIDFNEPMWLKPQVIPSFIDSNLMLALSITSLTAFFGLLDIGKPKPNDTIVISGAAGAVGSIAGQIAKLKHCKVIGIAGTDGKCNWLKNSLNFDHAINYKSDDVAHELDRYCPDGIDIYFDNVGGKLLDLALARLRLNARVILCGAISEYNQIITDSQTQDTPGIKNTTQLIITRSLMKGFVITDYLPKMQKGLLTLCHWLDQGKLKIEMDIQEGFDNIPMTLTRLFEGTNQGKQLLKLSEPPLPLNRSTIQLTLFKLFKWLSSFRK
jgi:NADPH-dependent curcumin reductase CurA